MGSPKLIRCIYCGLEKEPSDEHVLQKSLGGNLTTQLVCKECNTGFSTIDQSLAERSLLSLPRVGNASPESFQAYLGGDNVRLSEDGHWEDVRVGNRMVPEILPQIRIERGVDGKPARFAFAGSDPDEMRKLMQVIGDHISKGNLNKAYVKLSRPEVSKETRIVLHRHKDVYVRAATKEESKEFLKALAAKWSDIDRQVQESDLSVTSAPPGVVGVQVSICFDDNHRAIAKIAYNMLAVCKGSDFVLRDEFRPLREYIRGNEIVHDIPTDEKEPLVDKRFVGLIKHGDSPFIRTDSHIVVLAYSYPTLFAMVTLYSQFTYLVSMANIELSHPLTEAIEFSTDRSSFHRLTEMELFQRMPVPTPE